jgi:hypothetical protein
LPGKFARCIRDLDTDIDPGKQSEHVSHYRALTISNAGDDLSPRGRRGPDAIVVQQKSLEQYYCAPIAPQNVDKDRRVH